MQRNNIRAGRGGRVRAAIKRKSKGRLRLSVFRSSQHIYAQVIDDAKGNTLASASSIEKTIKALDKSNGKEVAGEVGKLIASRAISAGVDKVVFDRGAYLYHGRVKALAESARESGLLF